MRALAWVLGAAAAGVTALAWRRFSSRGAAAPSFARCPVCGAPRTTLVDYPGAWMRLVRCGAAAGPHFALVQEHMRYGEAHVELSAFAGERLAALTQSEGEHVVAHVDLFGAAAPTSAELERKIADYPRTYRGPG